MDWGALFHSSNNNARMIDLGDIGAWVRDGVLSLRTIQIGSAQYVNADEYAPNANGSEDHKSLMTAGMLFLKSIDIEPSHEKTLNGYRVDVTGGNWVIECGDTNAPPVIHHLRSGIDHVGILPYQPIEDLISLYVFERGNNWSIKSRIMNNGESLD